MQTRRQLLSTGHLTAMLKPLLVVFTAMVLGSSIDLSAQSVSVLSGNQFSTPDDFLEYGGYGNYAYPRTGVTYTYQDPVYTSGHELTNDSTNTKLLSGDLLATATDNMVYLGNSSGITVVSVVIDLGIECEVDSVDLWTLCGAASQVKKVTSSVSQDGISYTYIGTSYPPYPTTDTVLKTSQSTTSSNVSRYVKVTIEERSLDYMGGWSYRLSLGEIVILGRPLSSPLSILSGNTFFSTDDADFYGIYNNYEVPRSNASYSYHNQVNTGGDDVINDSANIKLLSGSITSTDNADMAYIGHTSGVTEFSVIYDLGNDCEVNMIDTWILSGLDTQIKKITFSVSQDGSSYSHLGTTYPGYPTGDTVSRIRHTLSTPLVARYIKILIEEKSLDYTGSWSYTVSLGEIVIIGTSLIADPGPAPLGPVGILSGNTFASSDDFQNYGSYAYYSTPRLGVTYSYRDPVYTGGDEADNDSANTKLTSGNITSTDSAHMVYLGNTSGVTLISAAFDLAGC